MTRPDEGDSAWAQEVEAAPAPTEFVFATGEQPEPPGRRAENDTASSDRAPRRWAAIFGAALGITLVAVAAAVWFDNGESDQNGSPDPNPAPNDLSELRDLASNPDDASVTSSGPASTLPVASQFEIDRVLPNVHDDFNDDFDAAPTYSVATGAWTTGSIEVPELLDAVAPMTLVVRTDRGLTEVDFPSGTTRTSTFESRFSFDEIAVGRTATYVSGSIAPGSADTRPRLLTAGLPPTFVDVPGTTLTMWRRPASNGFVGVTFDQVAQSGEELDVAPDGSFTARAIDLTDSRSLGGIALFAPNGNTIFSDDGSVFERTVRGTIRQLADGELVATSVHHVLTRSCVETNVCSATLFDYRDDTRSDVTLAPSYGAVSSTALPQISPDGRYLLSPTVAFGGSAKLWDLQTGDVIRFESSRFTSTRATIKNHAWAPDSSGYFRFSGDDFEFYDLATESSTALSQLGAVASYGVRLDLAGVPAPPAIENTAVEIKVRAADPTGAMYDLDLASGTVTTYDAPDDTPPLGPVQLIVGVDDEPTLLVTREGATELQLSSGDTSSIRIEAGLNLFVLPGPDGTGWRSVDDDDGLRYQQFDTSGNDLAATIRVPAELAVVGGDSNGALLAVAGNRSFMVLTPTSAELLTDGELLALGTTTAVVNECDTAGCTTVSIERATGSRTTLPDLTALQVLQPSVGLMVENTVSPDGAVIVVADDTDKWIVRDLAAPDTDDVALPSAPSPARTVVWSPDSQYAVYLSEQGVSLYDRRNATVSNLADAPPITTFAAL